MPRTFRFDDLTLREKAAVTYEELMEGFLRYEMMQQGIVRVPTPEPIPIPDCPIYTPKRAYELTVSGNGVGIFFEDASALEGFMALGPATCDNDWGIKHYSGLEIRGLNPDKKSFSIAGVDIVSTSEFKSIQGWVHDKRQAEEVNKRQDKEFELANIQVEDASSRLRDAWYDAGRKANKMEEILRTRRDYIEMSGGDEQIAYTFLIKAFTPEEVSDALAYEKAE